MDTFQLLHNMIRILAWSCVLIDAACGWLQMAVETLALAMVRDAESKIGGEAEEDAAVFSNKDMRRLASSK